MEDIFSAPLANPDHDPDTRQDIRDEGIMPPALHIYTDGHSRVFMVYGLTYTIDVSDTSHTA